MLVSPEDEVGFGCNGVIIECRVELVGEALFDGDSVVGDSKRLRNR